MSGLIDKYIGRYHVLEIIGEGGMAIVYKAYDTHLERDVAIKVIKRDAFPPNQLERIIKRFEREAKALARLSHPNIVKVLDYGEYEGAPFLIMEYLQGGSLKNNLGKPLAWQDTVKILLPITWALEYAHEHKIIHRDIKPSNILLTDQGIPMLTDFGIARLLDLESDTATLTGTGVGLGTPEYMAPEQWIGQSSMQSDIYSLGVVLYEMLTGHKPYEASTPAAILLKQSNDPLPNPDRFVPNLPESIREVLFNAMNKQAENRYKTASAFCQALENTLKSDSIHNSSEINKRKNDYDKTISKRTRVIYVSFFIFGISIAFGSGLLSIGQRGVGPLSSLATKTSSQTLTFTPSLTATITNTTTPTLSPTATLSPTITLSPTSTFTPTKSPTPTRTPTNTRTPKPTPTATLITLEISIVNNNCYPQDIYVDGRKLASNVNAWGGTKMMKLKEGTHQIKYCTTGTTLCGSAFDRSFSLNSRELNITAHSACPSSPNELITITIINEDCDSEDLYIDGLKVATVGGYSTATIKHYQGNLTLKACLAGTTFCGSSVKSLFNSDNSWTVYSNGCE